MRSSTDLTQLPKALKIVCIRPHASKFCKLNYKIYKVALFNRIGLLTSKVFLNEFYIDTINRLSVTVSWVLCQTFLIHLFDNFKMFHLDKALKVIKKDLNSIIFKTKRFYL